MSQLTDEIAEKLEKLNDHLFEKSDTKGLIYLNHVLRSMAFLPKPKRFVLSDINDRRNADGWIEGEIAFMGWGYRFQAKVFDEPSHHGIKKGRVSKLTISDGSGIVYNYDRGDDINLIPKEFVNDVVKWLGTLPPCESKVVDMCCHGKCLDLSQGTLLPDNMVQCNTCQHIDVWDAEAEVAI